MIEKGVDLLRNESRKKRRAANCKTSAILSSDPFPFGDGTASCAERIHRQGSRSRNRSPFLWFSLHPSLRYDTMRCAHWCCSQKREKSLNITSLNTKLVDGLTVLHQQWCTHGYRITVSDSSSNQSFVRYHLLVRFLFIPLSAAAAAAVAVLMQQKLKALIKSDKACLPPPPLPLLPLASHSVQSLPSTSPSIHPAMPIRWTELYTLYAYAYVSRGI